MRMLLVRELTIAGLLCGAGAVAHARPDDTDRPGSLRDAHERTQLREINRRMDRSMLPSLDRGAARADLADRNVGRPDKTMYEGNNRPQLKNEILMKLQHEAQRAPEQDASHTDHKASMGDAKSRATSPAQASALTPEARKYFQKEFGLRMSANGEKSADVEDKAK